MTVEYRGITASELEDLHHLDAILFGYAEDEPITGLLEPERVLCAFDGGRMVGSSAVLSLELTVPGGACVRMGGVTWVGVLTTHRRRGIMRALLTELLARIEAAGEPVAGLSASESVLYGRFGFGAASRAARVEVEALRAGFRRPCPDPGDVRLVEPGEALELLPGLHARVREERNGMVGRGAESMRHALRDAGRDREGMGPIRFAVHRDAAGQPDGLAGYRFRLSFDAAGLPDGELRVVELLAVTDPAAAALWRHCLDHDLVRRVVAEGRPVDEPVADLLADPRRWTQRPRDDLHLRPLDVPALLAARRYAREDAVTIEVVDPLHDGLGGRFRLEGGLEGATCTRVDTAPDIVLGSAALGSVYLGDVAVERLARAGLVEEMRPGAVRRATAMFAWSPLPWASYVF